MDNFLKDGYLHRYTPEFVEDIRSGKISREASGLSKVQYSYVKHCWGKKSQYRNKASGITGRRSWHSRPIGSERLDKDGYILVKVAYPRVEKRKHRYVWEQAYGKINADEIILFVDGDRTNCSLDNLIKVKRKYLGAINCFCRECITKEQKLAVIQSIILYCQAKDKEKQKRMVASRTAKLREVRHNPLYDVIYKLHNEGKSDIEISKVLGMKKQTVKYAIRMNNLKNGILS